MDAEDLTGLEAFLLLLGRFARQRFDKVRSGLLLVPGQGAAGVGGHMNPPSVKTSGREILQSHRVLYFNVMSIIFNKNKCGV